MSAALTQLAALYHGGTPQGVTSVCSAHPLVLRAALRHGHQTGATVLIEATCNQVNHRGGYTGMRPADFVALVHDLAAQEGCARENIVLGGDHLGPNPWRKQPVEAAMGEAEAMMKAYVSAGFRKIHLDASMGCAGEPLGLDDETTANRAAQLARVAEETARRQGLEPPIYIIGTEVPPPGGADHLISEIVPTSPDAARKTFAVHRETFARLGLSEAFERVIGLVVQPGVEFGNQNVVAYQPTAARDLVGILKETPSVVFEAHSTDYQGAEPLRQLVQDGFAILKVGPELTFVLREAFYALDLIASDLLPDYGNRPLFCAMEELMLEAPGYWESHYHGDYAEQRVLRHYSLSDRLRYYWTDPKAQAAVSRLIEALRGQSVPQPLFWQHMPAGSRFSNAPLDPEDLVIWRVMECLKTYHGACVSHH
ncbi:MAG: D-tagatose-bisphosphate aldolase, class II, non-catalytic subunit [Rhodobacteraceae bacterium]|nr:D-tagatose-bisphosphate aldolase, class II, non-catalytic subunit [Paracoccaceae bacterium]